MSEDTQQILDTMAQMQAIVDADQEISREEMNRVRTKIKNIQTKTYYTAFDQQLVEKFLQVNEEWKEWSREQTKKQKKRAQEENDALLLKKLSWYMDTTPLDDDLTRASAAEYLEITEASLVRLLARNIENDTAITLRNRLYERGKLVFNYQTAEESKEPRVRKPIEFNADVLLIAIGKRAASDYILARRQQIDHGGSLNPNGVTALQWFKQWMTDPDAVIEKLDKIAMDKEKNWRRFHEFND